MGNRSFEGLMGAFKGNRELLGVLMGAFNGGLEAFK